MKVAVDFALFIVTAYDHFTGRKSNARKNRKSKRVPKKQQIDQEANFDDLMPSYAFQSTEKEKQSILYTFDENEDDGRKSDEDYPAKD